MPAGGEVFAAGRYLFSWNGVLLGLLEASEGNAPLIEQMNHAEEIRNTDGYGKSLIDSIDQGADFKAVFTAMEYKNATISVLWPFSAAWGRMGVIGQLYYGLARPLIMAAVSNTPAAAAGPLTITAAKSILWPNFNVRLLHGPTLRKLALQLALFPVYSSNENYWFGTT